MPSCSFCHIYGNLGFVSGPVEFGVSLTLPKGFGATQGVFREYYFNNPPFKGNQLVASIGLLIVVGHARIQYSCHKVQMTLTHKGHLAIYVAFLTSFHWKISPVQAIYDVGGYGVHRGLIFRGRLLGHS